MFRFVDMSANQTIVLLRALPRPPSRWFGWLNFRRRYQPAANVMEVKRYLLNCVRKMKPELFPMPTLIVVDAGERNADIKSELERWINKLPRLRRVRVVCSPALWRWRSF